MELKEIKKRYGNDIGLFVILEYRETDTKKSAKGILKEILSDGKLKIINIKNPMERWEIDPNSITNYSVSPLRNKEDDNLATK